MKNKFLPILSVLLVFGIGVAALELTAAILLRKRAPLADAEAPIVDRGIPIRGAEEDLFAGMAPKTSLHPYLGYTLDPSLNPGTNDFGFLGPDATSAKPDNVIRVGITGGSVSQFLYSYKDEFKSMLEELPAFKSRPIEILSFGLQGYKQPQQLLALAYLLSLNAKFDVVINLDGINEAALPWAENAKRGDPVHYPRSWGLFARKAVPVEDAVLLGRLASLQDIRRRLAGYRTRSPWKYSNTFLLAADIADQELHGKVAAAQLVLDRRRNSELNGVGTGGKTTTLDREGVVRDSVALWRDSSIQMARLCAQNGIAYFHFLSPNQYMPGSRSLTKEEKRPRFGDVALDSWLDDIEEAVKAGYPLMVQEGPRLRAEKVNFFDLTGIFRDEPRTVYGDYCCHYNALGNRILMNNIATSIGRAMSAEWSLERGPRKE